MSGRGGTQLWVGFKGLKVEPGGLFVVVEARESVGVYLDLEMGLVMRGTPGLLVLGALLSLFPLWGLEFWVFVVLIKPGL
jgi:hypothetical protein